MVPKEKMSFQKKLSNNIGDNKMATIIVNWDVLIECTGEKLGFYPLKTFSNLLVSAASVLS